MVLEEMAAHQAKFYPVQHQAVANLEDELAVAECRLRKTDGARRIPHDEALDEPVLKSGDESEGDETTGSTGV